MLVSPKLRETISSSVTVPKKSSELNQSDLSLNQIINQTSKINQKTNSKNKMSIDPKQCTNMLSKLINQNDTKEVLRVIVSIILNKAKTYKSGSFD